MSILSNLFGGGQKEDPQAAAQQYLNQIPEVGGAYYNPYITRGYESSNLLHDQYQNLIKDPTAFINALLSSYKPSEGYQFQKKQLTDTMGNTAAAGGYAGTNYDQMQQAEGVQGLLSKDMQQYLQNALKAYGAGLTGEENFAGRGFQASGSLADMLSGALNQQGGLAFQAAQQRNADRNARSNSIFNTIAKGIGAGAGYYFGGPSGAAAGSQIGGSLFGG